MNHRKQENHRNAGFPLGFTAQIKLEILKKSLTITQINNIVLFYDGGASMKAKLTLNLDKELMEEAKDYAKENNVTLSTVVEGYLRTFVDERQNKEQDHSPTVDVSGMMNFDQGFDLGDYTNYLIDRYQ
jgi:hypothetical protein